MRTDAKNGDTWAQRQVDGYKARADQQKEAGGRKCGYCEERGHTRRTCSTRKSNMAISKRLIREYRKATLAWFKSIGLGTGALVKYDGSVYVSGQGRVEGPHIGLVTGIRWVDLHHRVADKYHGGTRLLGVRLTALPGEEQAIPIPSEVVLAPNDSGCAVEVISPVTASAVEAGVPAGWLTSELPEGWFDNDAKGWQWSDNTFDDGRFAKRRTELTETSNQN
jgi:hypothetical protein